MTQSIKNDLEALEAFNPQINLTAVIDSSGRGGNLFFLTLFDLHPEVACCPIVQYTYSYVLDAFGDDIIIDARRAHAFLTQKSYFRMVYNDLSGDNAVLFSRMGGTPGVSIDAPRLRALIDAYFASRQQVSRRELIVVPMLAYAIIRGQDPARIRYIQMGDAISRRHEGVYSGFSGQIIDHMLADFPDAKLFRLVRDPRATFASPRHQFVNSLGNMYAVHPGNYFSRLKTLLFDVLTPDNGCVYLYWLSYLRQTERTSLAKEKQFPNHIKLVKNEDLNLKFVETMISIATWLGIERLGTWNSSNFVPTVIGTPWEGAGAYNSRYQQATTGLLANDPAEVAKTVTGPNEYVTRRWRTRLNPREIELIEFLFFYELKKFDYEFLYYHPDQATAVVLVRTLLSPFEGELPKIGWIKTGFSSSLREGCDRLFYALTFIPFYIASRIKFLMLYADGKFARQP